MHRTKTVYNYLTPYDYISYTTVLYEVIVSNPRTGICLCGEPATIRKTKAEDGRLHFVCHDLTEDGKAKHYGFVDRSEAERLEVIEYDGELWVPDEETAGEVDGLWGSSDETDEPDRPIDSGPKRKPVGRFGFPGPA